MKKTKKAAVEKAVEDAKWVDEGSTATEKRRVEQAAKDAEAAKKRAEKKALADKEAAELAALSGKAKGVSNADKITRAQLLRQQEQAEEERKLEAERVKLAEMNLALPVEPAPNLNRQASSDLARDIEQFGAGNVIHASGIDSTLSSVTGGAFTSASSSSASSAPKPAPSMKSAFAEYEERQMPIVRRENPKLKLSQYKQVRRENVNCTRALANCRICADMIRSAFVNVCQMIFKEWQKSPENPFNIRKAQEQSLMANTDEWKYGNFRE